MRILLLIILLMPIASWGQEDRRSIFNEERTMDRRYTLYSGQFRVTGNYDMDIFKNSFDATGEKSLLSDRGISQNRHAFFFQLRYGIIDFLDVHVKAHYALMNYRGEPLYIVAPPQNPVQVYTTTTTRGFDDLYLGLNFRVPIPTRKLDIGLSGGIFLPTAESQQTEPQHSSSSDELGDIIDYQFINHWGYGVSSVFYKGHLKFRLKNFAFSANYQSRMPLGESEGISWSSRLEDDGSFTYSSSQFNRQVPQTVGANVLLEYQLFDWVNVHLSADHWRSIRGWTEESGTRIAIPDEKQTWLSPGYEVLVSSKLWLRQTIHFPLTGENTFSRFRISTTMYYNLFFY